MVLMQVQTLFYACMSACGYGLIGYLKIESPFMLHDGAATDIACWPNPFENESVQNYFFFFFFEPSNHRLESHRPLQPQVAREHSDSIASIMLNTGWSLKGCILRIHSSTFGLLVQICLEFGPILTW